jgi:hypothetical protein
VLYALPVARECGSYGIACDRHPAGDVAMFILFENCCYYGGMYAYSKIEFSPIRIWIFAE